MATDKAEWRGKHFGLILFLMILGLILSGCSLQTTAKAQTAGTGYTTGATQGANESNGQEGKPSSPDDGKDQGSRNSGEAGKGTDDNTAVAFPGDQGQDTGGETTPPQAPQTDVAPVPMTPPPPDPPQTPIRPFYELSGTPPQAPGLAMRHRIFQAEPKKIVYLTIDDGPSENTPQILKILKDEGVHATFFVIGRQVEKYPDYLKQEYTEGNAIGNHTYSHNYAEIYKSPEAFLANLKKNEDLIYRIIGIRPSIIRAPGGTQGNFHVSYYNAVDAAGYLVYDWNVSTGDAAAPLVPADQLVKNVESQIPGKDRAIILMHDAPGKTTTVEALPRIIQYLKKQGYTFGILKPEVAPILFPGGFRS